jgi:hypothetical protein
MQFHFNLTALSAVVLGNGLALTAASGQAASQRAACDALPSHAELTEALGAAVVEDNGGLATSMWATIVNRDGVVCAETFSDGDFAAQSPGSRPAPAQEAATAHAFGLPPGVGGIDAVALSTTDLWTAAQPGRSAFVHGNGRDPFPGGSLFGLQLSNPVDPEVADQSPACRPGQSSDPKLSQSPGSANLFGAGLALFDRGGALVGAVGVSGNTFCTDHNVAWRIRDFLGLDFVPEGVDTPADDTILDIADTANGNAVSPGGFGHPGSDGGAVDANVAVVTCPPGDGPTEGCVGAPTRLAQGFQALRAGAEASN